MKTFTLALLMIAFLSGCPTSGNTHPIPAPIPDASDASFSDLGTQVCTHLTNIGCNLDQAACIDVINSKQGAFTNFKPACLLNAGNTAQANACGSVRCP